MHLSKCLTIGLGVLALWGCQTGLQRPVAIRTEVLAPEMQVAPASAVELPARNSAPPVAPVLVTPAPGRAPNPWPTNWVNTWVPLESWGRFNAHTGFSRHGEMAYRVQTASGEFLIRIGSRIAEFDGLECWLGFAPRMIGGVPYVHWLDAQKTLQPLLRNGAYCCDKGGRTIVIDAGHGGRDLGAQSPANGAEKDYTLDWAMRLHRLLSTNGWKVIMTRESDVELDLSDRVALADRVNADFFLSLHFNSGAGNRELSGIETYCLTPTGMPSHLTRTYEDDMRQVFPNNAFDEQNVQAAFRLHRVLVQASGAQDRGVRRARFMTVLRGQNRPAVLVEGGYLSNPVEARRIASAAYRQTLAEAVARGLQMQ